MESKIQNTILIGDDKDNNENDNNEEGEDIFETIFKEMKENLKSVGEEEKQKEESKESDEKKKKKKKLMIWMILLLLINLAIKKAKRLLKLNINPMKMIFKIRAERNKIKEK